MANPRPPNPRAPNPPPMACAPIPPPCAAIPPCPPPPCPPPPCPPPPCPPPPPRAEAIAGARATAAPIAAMAAMVMKLFRNMIQPPWCPPRAGDPNGGGLRRAERSNHLGVTVDASRERQCETIGTPMANQQGRMTTYKGRRDVVELRTAAGSSLWQSQCMECRHCHSM